MKDEIMALPQRLRDAVQKLRRTPMPISDVAPMLAQAADALEKLVAENEQLQHLYRHNENEWQNRYDALRAELEQAKADAARMSEAMGYAGHRC